MAKFRCVFKSISVVLLFFGFSIRVIAIEEDAVAIARGALQTSPPGNWTLSGVLSTWATKEEAIAPIQVGDRVLTIQLKRGKDGTHEVIYYLEKKENPPEGIRIIFPKNAGDHLKIISLTPGELSSQKLFSGSAFSIDDISMHFLAWESQKLLGEEKLKDRPCWKIASYPSESESPYARVESWIDRQYRALLRAIAYSKDGKIIREFNVRSFQQLEDVWMLKSLDLDAPMLQARSRLEILDAKREE